MNIFFHVLLAVVVVQGTSFPHWHRAKAFQLSNRCVFFFLLLVNCGFFKCIIYHTKSSTSCALMGELTIVQPAVIITWINANTHQSLCSANNKQRYETCQIPKKKYVDDAHRACVRLWATEMEQASERVNLNKRVSNEEIELMCDNWLINISESYGKFKWTINGPSIVMQWCIHITIWTLCFTFIGTSLTAQGRTWWTMFLPYRQSRFDCIMRW